MIRTRPDLAAVLGRWQAKSHSLRHVRDGANAVYEFRKGSARLFLRVTEDRHRSRCQLEAELDFVRFVASRGVAAACPLLSSAGAWVETVQAVDEADWHAVVFRAAPGRCFRFFSDDIDRPLFRAWGSAMGALHAASRDFVPAESRQRPTWEEQDTTSCDLTRLPLAESKARREHALIAEWLGTAGVTPENWGMIHGDFERTNFVLDGDTLRLYDFDDTCHHWYLADVANALWAFRAAPPTEREKYLRWFLEGYRERSSVAADARERISWFVRLRSLSLFVNRLRGRTTTGTSAGDDRWEQRMRAEFEKPFWW